MQIAGTLLLALAAVLGGWMDVVSRRLPNWLSALTGVTGLTFVGLQSGVVATGWAAAHAALAIMIGMALFRFGVIGAGDAKFYAAFAAWFPLQQGLTLLIPVSLAGVVLVLAWFAYKQIRRVGVEARKGTFAMVPYGLAVGVGAVLARMLA